MPSHTLSLRGCTPEPLGNYLKALGVFRLVAEQADPQARAWWKDGILWIHTSNENFNAPEGVADWLLSKCQFSPFVTPWQTGSGYLPIGERAKGLAALSVLLSSDRAAFRRVQGAFREYAAALGVDLTGIEKTKWIEAVHQAAGLTDHAANTLLDLVKAGKVGEAVSHRLLRNNVHEGAVLDWLDAVGSVVTSNDGEEQTKWFSLLASGGGESSGQYIVNLQQRLAEAFGSENEMSRVRVLAALDGRQCVGIFQSDAMGAMYFPGLIKGFNSGQDFASPRRVNPWDFILLLEGTLLWASSVTRRGSVTKQLTSFPFFSRSSLGGAVSLGPKEVIGAEGSISNGEIWCPLWSKPTTLSELRRVFSDGRLQVGPRTCESALEFVRAIARFGVDRGLSAFVRYGLLKRSGSGRQTTLLAVPLQTVPCAFLPNIDLLDELDDFRQAVEDLIRPHSNQPPRLVRARMAMEAAWFDCANHCLQGDSVEARQRLLNALVATARVEREVGVTVGDVKYKVGEKLQERSVSPIPPQPFAWLIRNEGERACPVDDGTHEFGIARAIATICAWGVAAGDPGGGASVASLRGNLLSVQRPRDSWAWDGTSRSTVWSHGVTLLENCGRVLQRRLIDSTRGKGDGRPLWSFFGASFTDLLHLWHGEFDEGRVDELVHALALVDTERPTDERITVFQRRSDPTPDLSPTSFYYDRAGEPQVNFESPIWHGKPLLGPHGDEELKDLFALPRAYALLKLCFVGGRLPARPVEASRRPVTRTGNEPYPPMANDVLALLVAGQSARAVGLAARKLRAKGYPSIVTDSAITSREFELSLDESRRMAGLLLIPIRYVGLLAALAIKPIAH